MLKLPTTEQLVMQAIKANKKHYKEAEKEYYYWWDRINKQEAETGEVNPRYVEYKESYFTEFVTIKHTLVRLFPKYEDLIIDNLLD